VRTFVWVESWQQQCCGDEFQVGSSVTWNVTRAKDAEDWVTTLLGPDWGEKVRYTEDHHGLDEGLGRELRGVVRSIHVVTCDRKPEHQPGRSPSGQVWVLVPSSGRLREVEVADPWEPEPSDDDPHQSFDGWVVEVEVEEAP
jgi:hypothetical protein